jgi:hypothetical protein
MKSPGPLEWISGMYSISSSWLRGVGISDRRCRMRCHQDLFFGLTVISAPTGGSSISGPDFGLRGGTVGGDVSEWLNKSDTVSHRPVALGRGAMVSVAASDTAMSETGHSQMVLSTGTKCSSHSGGEMPRLTASAINSFCASSLGRPARQIPRF